jgi:hypothetical protein
MSHALLRNVAIIFGMFVPNIVGAQDAPLTDSHYGGRASDTGYGGTVTPNGGYQASIPFDLPPTRDGTPIPFQLVSSGASAGAAGLGWDVPLSFIHVDNTYVHRKPYGLEPLGGVQSNQQVFMSLNGHTTQLIPTQTGWAPRVNAPMLSAQHATSTAPWTVNDGYGRTYMFTQPAGFEYLGIWLLTSVTGPSGPIMTATYNVATVLPSGTEAFVSIDLATIDYNVSSSLGCAKNEIKLEYNADGSPLSLSILGFNVLTRLHTLANVRVQSRSDCSSFTALRTYTLTYAADTDTGMLDRISSVSVVGRTGTPENGTSIPIASYTYTAATTTGRAGHFISFDAYSSIQMPSHQSFDSDQDYLPIERSSTTVGYEVLGDNTTQLPGPNDTFTEWRLQDVNGDGYPDFVYNTEPLQYYEYGTLGSNGAELFYGALGGSDGGVNDVDVAEHRWNSAERRLRIWLRVGDRAAADNLC